jgi:hypothetical protein
MLLLLLRRKSMRVCCWLQCLTSFMLHYNLLLLLLLLLRLAQLCHCIGGQCWRIILRLLLHTHQALLRLTLLCAQLLLLLRWRRWWWNVLCMLRPAERLPCQLLC